MNNNITFPPLNSKPRHCASAGFTLIEMLVVISIITILLSAGAVGIKNLAETGGVSAAVPTTEAVFSYARELAIGKGSKARVLINADEDDHEKYLRYMIVAYQDEDENGNVKWIATARGSTLPKSVYFSQKYSFAEHSQSSGAIEEEDMDFDRLFR